MIKKVILILMIGLACFGPLSSQITLVEDQDLSLNTTTLEYYMGIRIFMAVGDENPGEFYWELTRTEPLPEEWQFGVTDCCVGYNYGWEASSPDKPNYITSGDTIVFTVDLNHSSRAGQGCITLRLWPKVDSTSTLLEIPLCYNVEFASSTIDTEIVIEVLVTPNPVADFLTVDIVSSELSDVQLEVINNIGQLVAKQTVNVSSGSNTVTFDAVNYSNGVYSIITRSDAGITTTKFVVSK